MAAPQFSEIIVVTYMCYKIAFQSYYYSNWPPNFKELSQVCNTKCFFRSKYSSRSSRIIPGYFGLIYAFSEAVSYMYVHSAYNTRVGLGIKVVSFAEHLHPFL